MHLLVMVSLFHFDLKLHLVEVQQTTHRWRGLACSVDHNHGHFPVLFVSIVLQDVQTKKHACCHVFTVIECSCDGLSCPNHMSWTRWLSLCEDAMTCHCMLIES